MTTTVHEITAKNLQDGDINEERATRFFVVTSTSRIDPVSAAVVSGIPSYFDAHPTDGSYLVKNKRTRTSAEESGGTVWEVQVEYSNRIINPLSMPAQIEWDFSEASETYFFDCNTSGGFTDGHPVLNSAGQHFESIPSRETGAIIANVTKNVATDFDVSVFLSNRENINSATFALDGVTVGTLQAKFSGAHCSPPQLSNGTWYRTVKLQLKFKASWLDVFADMGTYQKMSATAWAALGGTEGNYPGDGVGLAAIAVSTPITPPAAGVLAPVPVAMPWPLDGAGNAKTNATDKPAKLTFQPYIESDIGSALSDLLT